ncbi:MAG: PEP-CTERM sorting domain-containing protein [Verrucomicrobiota bacterium]
MKTILAIILSGVVASGALAQGIVNFGNSSSTLISVDGVAMPGSSVSTFYFAVFMAPSGTVTADFTTIPNATAFTDPTWGSALYTTVNHATAAGRLATTAAAAQIPGYAGGSTADFIIRAWSANAGTTYAQALAAYNSGSVPSAIFGTSARIGNNIVLSDGAGIPVTTLFGVGGNQVGGFNLITQFPEPSSMALTGLGAAFLLVFRRRNAV